MITPDGFDKLLTANVALVGVAFDTVVPTLTAEYPAKAPPATKPFAGPFAGKVRVWAPGDMEFTASVKVQLPSAPPAIAAAMVPPVRITPELPGTAVTLLKPQLSENVALAATVTPAGSKTVTAADVRLLDVALL